MPLLTKKKNGNISELIFISKSQKNNLRLNLQKVKGREYRNMHRKYCNTKKEAEKGTVKLKAGSF